MTSDFVTLENFATPTEAELCRLELENEGITCLVANTSTQYLIGMGSAVPCALKVKAEDLEKARAILAARKPALSLATEPYSPRYARKRRIGKILFVVMVGGPIVVSAVWVIWNALRSVVQ